MADIIITPSTGKIEFVDNSAQNIRKHAFSMDEDGLSLDAPLAATSIKAPLNIINVNVDNSNTNYPFVLASGSAVTGTKTLMMDGAGGTYNPFTNTATIDVSGNSATTTLASNSTQLNGQAASYYTDITARLGYTPVNQAGGTVTGNLTVNGNFAVNGSFTAFSASNVYISSSQLYIEDNILTLNAFSPYLRYAGVEMYDSGSGTLSSLLWDGESDYFFLTGSSVNGKIITGPDGQTNLTANFVPKATAGYKLGNSVIYDDGTNVGIGTTIPGRKLHLYAPQSVISLSNTGTGAWSGLQWSVGNGAYTAYSGLLDDTGRYFIDVGSNGEDFTILQNGSIGIGTSSPAVMLHVQKSQNSETTVIINNTNSGAAAAARLDLQSHANNYLTLQAYGQNFSGNVCGIAGAKLNTILDNALTANSTGLLIGTVSTNPMYFVTANSVKMLLSASGNLGIGTTSPAYKLDVNGTIALSGFPFAYKSGNYNILVEPAGTNALYLGNATDPTNYYDNTTHYIRNRGGGSTYVTINSSGNVGIGTTNPTSKLHIVGDSIFNGQISSTGAMAIGMTPAPFWNARFTDYSDGSGVYIGSVQAGGYKYISGESYYNNSSFWQSNKTTSTAIGLGDGILRFYTDSGLTANTNFIPSERMRITSTGCVGIGTTSVRSNSLLDVYGAGVFGTSAYGFYVGTDATGAFLDAGTQLMRMFAGQQERMRITSTGNVGIGTTNPVSKLEVSGSVTATSFTGSLSGSITSALTASYLTPANSYTVTNLNASATGSFGMVGIGTTSPTAKLHVVGDEYVTGNVTIGLTSNYSNLNFIRNGGSAVGGVGWRSDGYFYVGGHPDYGPGAGNDVRVRGFGGSLILGTNSTDYVYLNTSGKVGIGTSSPSNAKVHIVGDGSYVGDYGYNTLRLEDVSGYPGLNYRNGNANWLLRMNGGDTGFDIAYSSNASAAGTGTYSQLVKIKNDGNVGIGTTSPGSLLHVSKAGNSAGGTILMGVVNNSTAKWSYLVSTQYNSSTYPQGFSVIGGVTNSTSNTVVIGGSIYEANPATEIQFYTHTAVSHATGGSLRMVIDTNGNVGIGTTSPAAKLNISLAGVVANTVSLINVSSWGNNTVQLFNSNGGTTGNEVLLLGTQAGGNGQLASGFGFGRESSATWGTYISLKTHSPSTSVIDELYERMRIAADGNVGIGTTSPGNKLEVKGADDAAITAIFQSTAGGNAAYNGGIQLGNAASSQNSQIYHNSSGDNTLTFVSNYGSGTGNKFIFSPGGTERVRFQQNGNVGIGTTSPSQALHILTSNSGNNGLTIATTSATGNPQIRFLNSAGAEKVAITYASSADAVYFYTAASATNLMNFVGANVGIGTTSPGYKLHVTGDIYANGGWLRVSGTSGLYFETYGGGWFMDDATWVRTYSAKSVWTSTGLLGSNGGLTVGYGGTSPTSLGAIISGSVGIGSTSPAHKLDVDGTIRSKSGTTGTLYLGQTSGGTTYVAAALIGTPSATYNPVGKLSIQLPTHGVGTDYGLTEQMSIQVNTSDSKAATMLLLPYGGSVGIGTSSPGALLNVNGRFMAGGTTSDIVTAHILMNTTGVAIQYTGNTGNYLMISPGNANTTISLKADARTGAYPPMDFWTSNTSRMTILANGNLGIGTTSPATKLEVYGVVRVSESSSGGILQLTAGASAIDIASTFYGGSRRPITFTMDSEKVRIAADGNVGIGTTSPATLLHVDTAGADARIRVSAGSNTVQGGMIANTNGLVYAGSITNHGFSLRTNDTDRVRIQTDGNVGIGTTGPSARLHVFDSNESPATGNLLVTSTGGNASIRIDSQNTSKYTYFTLSQGGVGKFELGITPTSSDLYINHNVQSGANGAAIYIKKADGNVGIGTTAPGAPLTIYKASNPWIRVNGGGAFSYIQLDDATSSGYLFKNTSSDTSNGALAGAMYTYTDSNKAFQHIHAGTPLFTILSGGNVGIGSTSPGYKLDVVGDINFSSTLKFGGINVISNASGDVYLNGRVIRNESNSSQDGMYIGYNSTGTTNAHIRFYANAGNERMRIQANDGNVGIGTTSAGKKLDVEGVVRTRGASGTGGFEIGAATTGTAKWRIEWDSASDSLDFNWVG